MALLDFQHILKEKKEFYRKIGIEMQKRELKRILEELKAELATSQFTKPSSQQELQKLIEQIEQSLIDDEGIVQKALNEPLNDAVTRFEGSHPQLTLILNNIITQLSSMGI